MNKRGFLLADETLKIIMAVVCLAFLAYFLSLLYLSKTGGEKREAAESALDRIEEIVQSLDDGQSENQSIGTPKNWHIFSFVDDTRPNSCLGEDCLCICSKVADINGLFERQIKECDSDGVCLVIENLRSADLDVKINGEDSLVFLNIEKTSQGIFIEEIE
jgi:hypothetical protein